MKKQKNKLMTIIAFLVLGIGTAITLSSFVESGHSGSKAMYALASTDTDTDSDTDTGTETGTDTDTNTDTDTDTDTNTDTNGDTGTGTDTNGGTGTNTNGGTGTNTGTSPGSGGPLFEKSVDHPYACQATTVTYTTYYNGNTILYTKYSNGAIKGNAETNQTVTGTATGSMPIKAFNTHWIECLSQLGLGCTPCVPIQACTVGCV